MTPARTGWRVIAAAAIAAAAALCIVSAVPASSPARAAPAAAVNAAARIPRCTASDLGAWVAADRGNGALGSIYYPLEFTNLSGHACYMYGFPGVSAIDRNGHQLGSPARWDHSVTARAVVLAPGATAHTVLRYVDAEVYTSGCRPGNAAELKIYPPDQYGATHALWDFGACTLAGRIFMYVQPLQPGTGTTR
ncbi:MAG TPA: DUF4232 domain-containing protein [Streptosporangiaceae bacterium]|nr:DUF4232 domain-containing protein [Streptosporangiaceae bacterium]